jgi:4-amino-4-deoxy-L-arabinose transferase-like glycosyltransferase
MRSFYALADHLKISIHQLAALLVGMILVAAGSIGSAKDATLTAQLNLVLWIFGVCLVFLGLRSPERAKPTKKSPITWELGLFLLILTLGCILRVIRLESMPFILSGDEGSAGLIGIEFLEGPRNNIVGIGWFSFPALYFWLLSFLQTIFGRTVLAIRLLSALAGTLTILGTYLAGKELFSPKVGFIAAAWLASFHYHVFFSRIAYNNIFDGLSLVLLITSLHQAWQRNQRGLFLVFGLILGFSQYFYTTSRILPLILLLWLPWLSAHHGPLRQRSIHLLPALLLAGCVVLPLGLAYIREPSSLTFTAGRVSLLDPDLLGPAAEALGTTPLGLILEQTLVTVLGLTVGELQGIYFGTAQPMLFGLTALGFYVGFLVTILRWRRPSAGILLTTLAVSVLIGGLSVQAPSSQRLILLPPVLALIITTGLVVIQEWLGDHWPYLRLPSMLVLALALVWMMVENVHFLFDRYFPNESYGSLNGEVAQEMAAILWDQEPDLPIYFVGGDRMQFDSIPSLDYLAPGYHAQSYSSLAELELPQVGVERTLMIVLPEQLDTLQALRQSYPMASENARYNRHGRLLFYSFEIDPFDGS